MQQHSTGQRTQYAPHAQWINSNQIKVSFCCSSSRMTYFMTSEQTLRYYMAVLGSMWRHSALWSDLIRQTGDTVFDFIVAHGEVWTGSRRSLPIQKIAANVLSRRRAGFFGGLRQSGPRQSRPTFSR
jgi:hypothetical protein